MIFREMSRKLKSPRAAAEEDKKRKDLHEDSDEALVDGEEEVHVAPSRKANKVSIGDAVNVMYGSNNTPPQSAT